MNQSPVEFRMELYVNEHMVDAGAFALPADEELRPALGIYLRTLAQWIEDGHALLPVSNDL